MGAWGALVMGFFGSFFASMTLFWQWHVRGASLTLPFLVFGLIMGLAVRVIRSPGLGIKPSSQEARVIQWSSIAEGIGLFIIANVVITLGRPDLLLPSMALVVGLHFLPIARVGRFVPFYVLGVALIAGAALGVIVGGQDGGTLAGFTGALAIWTAALLAVERDRRTKAGAMTLA